MTGSSEAMIFKVHNEPVIYIINYMHTLKKLIIEKKVVNKKKIAFIKRKLQQPKRAVKIKKLNEKCTKLYKKKL